LCHFMLSDTLRVTLNMEQNSHQSN
jgi:hypothetical protein